MSDKRRLLIAVLVSCLSLGAAGLRTFAQEHEPTTQPVASNATSQPVERAPNPHWVNSRCNTCHQLRGSEALPIPAVQVDRTCLDCHDGRRAGAEKHPVGRLIPASMITLPKDWPVLSGRLGCVTCHDLSQTTGHKHGHGVRSASNPDFLRGTPSPEPLAFCAQCHAETGENARHNPHRMLSQNKQIEEQSCLFCHTRTFKPAELRQRSGQPSLKTDAITLCMGCHTQHIDYFDPGHIGARATPEIVAHMAAMDRAHPGEAVSPADVDQAAQRDEQPTRLPLSHDNIIVCSTCHNPHEKSVFPQDSILEIGGVPRTSGPHLTPVRLGTKLCGECHGK